MNELVLRYGYCFAYNSKSTGATKLSCYLHRLYLTVSSIVWSKRCVAAAVSFFVK